MRGMVLLGVVALAVSGCSDAKTASKDNFKTAINAYVETQQPCLRIPASIERPEGADAPDFPRYVSAVPTTTVVQQQGRERERAPFDALVEAGLLSATDTTIKVRSGLFAGDVKDMPVRAYDLTPAGRDAVSEVGARTAITRPEQRFCYGKPAVDEVVSYTEPADVMGVRASQVTYRYHLADLPGWATHPTMLDAFAQLKRDTAPSIEAKAAVILTSEGWVHERTFKR